MKCNNNLHEIGKGYIINIRTIDGRRVGFLEENIIRDNNGIRFAVIESNIVRDNYNTRIGFIEDNIFRDNSGSRLGSIDGKYVRDNTNNKIGFIEGTASVIQVGAVGLYLVIYCNASSNDDVDSSIQNSNSDKFESGSNTVPSENSYYDNSLNNESLHNTVGKTVNSMYEGVDAIEFGKRMYENCHKYPNINSSRVSYDDELPTYEYKKTWQKKPESIIKRNKIIRCTIGVIIGSIIGLIIGGTFNHEIIGLLIGLALGCYTGWSCDGVDAGILSAAFVCALGFGIFFGSVFLIFGELFFDVAIKASIGGAICGVIMGIIGKIFGSESYK